MSDEIEIVHGADPLTPLEHRRSTTPLLLGGPGPDDATLRRLLTIALRVPDHGKLEPWRLIVLRGDARHEVARRLTNVYTREHPDDDAEQRERQIAKTVDMLTVAPVVVVVVSRVDPLARKPEWEQVLSAGAVCMNLLTALTLAGFDGVWLTGWSSYSEGGRQALGLENGEKVAGIIPIGTASEQQKDRPRPDFDRKVSFWQPSAP